MEVRKPNFPAAHVEYFKSYGWTLKEYEAVNTYESGSLLLSKEHYDLLVNEGKLDLAPCASKDIIESGYDLEETVGPYNDIIGYIVECEGKTIGGYLTLQTETLHGDIYDITTGPTVPIVNREDALRSIP
ncbi:DUF4830 domain-containing protein [Paenibacillus albus]|uniref:DUF4830 domain-containing protein n=1 Tax=Paenibacillus albus TaxID=2495582 RepID=UPI0013DF584C|nr:DUF4830 domain-containing protein [Paenibacillus albus]